MCELVIRVLDKSTPDDPKRSARTQRGDVIDIRDDGWPWTQGELNNPAWRFVRLPGLPASSLIDLLQPVFDADGALIQRRGRGVDLSLLSDVEAGWSRGQVHEVTAAARTRLLAARKDKASQKVVIG